MHSDPTPKGSKSVRGEGRAVAGSFYMLPLPSLTRCHLSGRASYLNPHNNKTKPTHIPAWLSSGCVGLSGRSSFGCEAITRDAWSISHSVRCSAEMCSTGISPSGTGRGKMGPKAQHQPCPGSTQKAGVRWIAPSSKNPIQMLAHF